jgi:hypothetical protein
MALPYIRAPSETHYVSDTAGSHHFYLLTVFVAARVDKEEERRVSNAVYGPYV